MKYILMCFVPTVCLILMTACENDRIESCDIEDAIHNIAWLKELKADYSQDPDTPTRITQYTYHGECAFMVEHCVQCPDAITVVYNEEQEELCKFGGIAGFNTCPDFDSQATNPVVLWSNAD